MGETENRLDATENRWEPLRKTGNHWKRLLVSDQDDAGGRSNGLFGCQCEGTLSVHSQTVRVKNDKMVEMAGRPERKSELCAIR